MLNIKAPRDLEACKAFIATIDDMIGRSTASGTSIADDFQHFAAIVTAVEEATANAWGERLKAGSNSC
jgi:hypothetical protein